MEIQTPATEKIAITSAVWRVLLDNITRKGHEEYFSQVFYVIAKSLGSIDGHLTDAMNTVAKTRNKNIREIEESWYTYRVDGFSHLKTVEKYPLTEKQEDIAKYYFPSD